MSIYDNYPKPIKDFLNLYEGTEIFDKQTLETIDQIFEDCDEYFHQEYQRIFPTGKILNADYILNQIFTEGKNKIGERQYIKIHLTSIINQFQTHVLGYYSDIKENITKGDFKFSDLRRNLVFVYHFLDDFMQFYSAHYSIFHKGENSIFLLRRIEPFSAYKTIHLSEQLMLGKLDGYYGFDYYSIHNAIPSTISLIRTTQELILKNSLGINSIKTKNGSFIKISSYIFLDFFKDNSDKIEFPIDFSIFSKIYEWSNYFIHNGEVSYYWLICEAHSTLCRFFPFAGLDDPMIKFDEELYDNRSKVLTHYLSQKLNIPEDDIEIDLNYRMELVKLKNKK